MIAALKLLAGPLIDGGLKLVSLLSGNREARDSQAADDMVELRRQVAAEATAPERVNPWNAFIDGLNRLPRPLMTLGVVALFWWAAEDPISFSASMTAIQLIPEALWVILGTIVVFWFGGKTIEGIRSGGKTAAEVRSVVQQIAEIKAMQAPPSATDEPTQVSESAAVARLSESAAPVMSDRAYNAEMAAPEPLSNAAIAEWARRRRAGQP